MKLNEKSDKDEPVEATVKLSVARFPVTMTVLTSSYLELLRSFEYQGISIDAVLMQTLGDSTIWITRRKDLVVDPEWETQGASNDSDLPDDYEA